MADKLSIPCFPRTNPTELCKDDERASKGNENEPCKIVSFRPDIRQ